MESIRILRGLPSGSRQRAAELYWEAFGRKIGPALNPPERGIAFLARHLDPDRAVAAVLDEKLVGLAGYQHDGRSLIGGGASEVIHSYGWSSGIFRVALLALLERSPRPGRLLMDGIAVDPAMRGRGVGSLLLAEIGRLASELGYQEVRLDVVDINPRARALYERAGFVASKTEQTPFLRKLLGFGAVTTMSRGARS